MIIARGIMMSRTAPLALLLLLPSFFAKTQTGPSQDVFTIVVGAPTAPRDVQVRYVLSGNSAAPQAGSIAEPQDDRIVVKTAVADKMARGFRAIVYAPGCQFGTISANDLSTNARQADFQCQRLSSVSLHGKADISPFARRDLQVDVLYECDWAGQFFGIPGLAISPFFLAKARVEDDGTFTADLPDFAGDPLWASLSHNATIVFMLLDASTGERLARLSAPRNLSRKGALKVANSYPEEIVFAVMFPKR